MKKLFIPLLFVLIVAFTALPLYADNSVQVTGQDLKFDYPKTMTFTLNATAPAQITDAVLVVKFPDSSTRLVGKFTPGSTIQAQAVWNLGTASATPGAGGYLPPGAAGTYSWTLTDSAGNKTETPSKDFTVEDNRFEWQHLESPRVAVNWYQGDQRFGQAILDRGNQVLDQIEKSVGAKMDKQIEVYIWGNHLEYLSAIGAGSPEWSGGTINEDFQTVLMDGSDESFALTVTPHEMTHLVLHQAVGKGLGSSAFPLWMDEGLAVYHESFPAQPEQRFQSALNDAISTDSVYRLRSLASNFPGTGVGVELAYGQSYSVVDYMIKNYGRDKLQQILQLFHSGVGTDDAFKQVLGVDTDGLDNLWRKSQGLAEHDYSNSGIPTPAAIPTFSLSGSENGSSSGSGSSGSSSPTSVPAATITPAAVSLASTPSSAGGATTVPQSSSSNNNGAASTGLCGGLLGGMALAMVGGYGWRKRRRSPKL